MVCLSSSLCHEIFLKADAHVTVIFDFVIGMPLSLVVSFLTKCVMRLIFAAALYFNTRQVTGDNETALTVKSTAVNGTTGPPNLEVGGNKEEWIQWERLLCGLVFAITNSFLIIRWALAFEASGIESMAKERRLGMLKEEANEWESLVGKLESVLDVGFCLHLSIVDIPDRSADTQYYRLFMLRNT